MKILFTLCGRAGSKGIKNKNISNFCGKPLPYYSIAVIDLYVKMKELGKDDYDVVLSTDSPELITLIDKNTFMPIEVINRVNSLSGDAVGKVDVILDCLEQMETRRDCKYDLVVDLDLTSPLRTVGDLDNLINKSIETNADITYSVTSARRNPYFNQVTKGERGYHKVCEANFTARQQAPVVYDMNASLYAYKPEHLRSKKGFNEGYFEIIEMFDTAVLDLDHENDLELMQVIAHYLFENYRDFLEIYEFI